MKFKPAYFKTSVRERMRDPISPATLQTVLELVDVLVPRYAICQWTMKQRAIAEDWGVRLHLNASDNVYVRVPRKPGFVTRSQVTAVPSGDHSAMQDAIAKHKREGTLYDVLPSLKGGVS